MPETVVMNSTKYFDADLFKSVFSGSEVVDVDFSEWDNYIALWMLTDHYSNWTNQYSKSQCSIMAVKFENVRTFSCEIPPFNAASKSLQSPEISLQWSVANYEIQQLSPTIRVRFWGSEDSPSVIIECDAITFQPLELGEYTRLFQNGRNVASGLFDQASISFCFGKNSVESKKENGFDWVYHHR